MPGLFGSLFFLLLPMYDILQQGSIVHPIVQIISVLILLLTIISAAFTAKKFAYLKHDLFIAQKKNEVKSSSFPLSWFFNLTFMFSLTFLTLFLMIKTLILKSVGFFFQSLVGTPVSVLLSILLYSIFLWSAFILIQTHLNEQYPKSFVSFWGKQVATMQTTSKRTEHIASNTAGSLEKKLKSFKPPFLR